ncbi:hypothetical protein [Streptomyces sp. D2-8]|nr:hypothetical protein [Streptomyces sp. D2-8]
MTDPHGRVHRLGETGSVSTLAAVVALLLRRPGHAPARQQAVG